MHSKQIVVRMVNMHTMLFMLAMRATMLMIDCSLGTTAVRSHAPEPAAQPTGSSWHVAHSSRVRPTTLWAQKASGTVVVSRIALPLHFS